LNQNNIQHGITFVHPVGIQGGAKVAKKAARKLPARKAGRAGKSKPALTRIEAGARMSQAVVHDGRVFLAGQVANETKGMSVAEQTAEILAGIDRLLKRAGTDKTRLLSANIWLADISTFAEMNSVWDKWVVAGRTPARATVEAKLAAPEYTVEIMVTAAL
jgi:enamine deaminase RidA (YjgF/YER057c/UK114 family)